MTNYLNAIRKFRIGFWGAWRSIPWCLVCSPPSQRAFGVPGSPSGFGSGTRSRSGSDRWWRECRPRWDCYRQGIHSGSFPAPHWIETIPSVYPPQQWSSEARPSLSGHSSGRKGKGTERKTLQMPNNERRMNWPTFYEFTVWPLTIGTYFVHSPWTHRRSRRISATQTRSFPPGCTSWPNNERSHSTGRRLFRRPPESESGPMAGQVL